MFNKKKKKEKEKEEEKIDKKENNSEKEDNHQEERRDDVLGSKGRPVLGGFLGDRDSRTMVGFRRSLYVIGSIGVLTFGIGSAVVANNNYRDWQLNNTTEIGTELSFAKTDGANITFKSVWTDKNHDLTVVRLGYDDTAHKALSFLGKNYGLHIVAKSKSDIPKNFKMYYGVLGTQGDGYLFLKGKMPERAYQIFITNRSGMTSDLTGDSSTENSDDNSLNIQEGENVKEALAQDGGTDAVNNNGILDNLSKDSTAGNIKNDTINFRINSYSKNTDVYDGSFLDSNGDIDYQKTLKVIALDPSIKDMKKKIKDIDKEINSYQKNIKEYETRLSVDKNDSTAKDNLATIHDSIDNAKDEKKDLLKQLSILENTKLSRNDFKDMQTQYNIIYDNNNGKSR